MEDYDDNETLESEAKGEKAPNSHPSQGCVQSIWQIASALLPLPESLQWR